MVNGGDCAVVVHGSDTAQRHRPHLSECTVVVHRACRRHRHTGVVALAALVGRSRCSVRRGIGVAVRHCGAQITLCQSAARP